MAGIARCKSESRTVTPTWVRVRHRRPSTPAMGVNRHLRRAGAGARWDDQHRRHARGAQQPDALGHVRRPGARSGGGMIQLLGSPAPADRTAGSDSRAPAAHAALIALPRPAAGLGYRAM